MADRWQDLRATFKAKNRDLDAEFEKFLNESLSDESSVGSPRRISRDFKSAAGEGTRTVQPSWEEEDSSDIVQHRNTTQKTSQNQPSESSGFDVAALSISKDSLEEGTVESSTSPDRPRQTAPGPGLDTLNEEEKRQFFDQEEEGVSSSVDYEEKLKELSATETPHPPRDNTDYLQATGTELGESIFNQSGEMPKSESREEYSENFEESEKSSEDSQRPAPAERQRVELLDAAKPSMLSKVSLMESLDSTLDVKRNAALDEKKNYKGTGEEDGVDPKESEKGPLSSGNALGAPKDSVKGFMSSGTTRELRELEAALQAAQLASSSEVLPDPAFQPPVMSTVTHPPPAEEEEEGHMMLEKMPSGATRVQGFDLQPIIVNDVTEASGDDGMVKPFKERESTVADTPSFIALDANAQENFASGSDLRAVTSAVSPASEGRGFTLQPLANLIDSTKTEGNESAGAQSVRDSRTEDEDVPPADSLRGIKSIARARRSAGLEEKKRGTKAGALKKSVTLRDARRTQESGKKGKLKRQELQPSPSSVPTWSPTPNTRRGTPKSKRPTSHVKSPSRAEKPSVDKSADQATEQLMTSVDSFANYLKQFVRPGDDQENQPPPVRWSNDEPSRSASKGVPSETQRVSRERALQEEVANWQMAWKDERRRNDKLIADIAAREKENFTREEKSRLAYQQQVHDLQQEVLALQSNLENQLEEADVKRRVLGGASLQGASTEELQRMEKEIREQEELLKGYQVENERLYKELKQVQAKSKAREARLFSENQKLASEVLNLKEKVEQLRPAIKISSPGTAVLAAEKLADLQAQVASLRRRETELQGELMEEKESKVQLEMRLRREKAASEITGLKPSSPDLQTQHAAELEKLHRKLKWYAENQQLLDRDTAALQRKEREIQELHETVARLQAHHDQSATEKSKRNAERTADAKRIQDLERQVREMEEIIRRRYPNSLPALIYAAASAPGHAQPTKEDTPKKESPSHVFLENRIKKLEAQLEEKENDAGKRIRVIEQKYNAMKFAYEERIQELDRELNLTSSKLKDGSHAHAESLQKELLTNQRRVEELQTEVQVLQDALAKASTSVPTRSPRARRKLVEEESDRAPTRHVEEEGDLKTLEKELQKRNAEVEELKQTCGRLQREREQMLAGVDKQIGEARTEALSQENSALSEKLSRLALEIEQERVRHQACRAEAERTLRQVREEAADMVENLQAQHKRDMNELKAGFAVSKSSSKMAELQNKASAQEVVIQRLKEKLTQAAGDAASLTAARVRQQTLQERVEELEKDLRSAREKFSPEMQHFDALESKVVALERKHSQREHELQRKIDSNLIKACVEKEETEAKWRQVLQQKHQEIEKFRSELDAILEVLSELRRQGVMIPFNSREVFYS